MIFHIKLVLMRNYISFLSGMIIDTLRNLNCYRDLSSGREYCLDPWVYRCTHSAALIKFSIDFCLASHSRVQKGRINMPLNSPRQSCYFNNIYRILLQLWNSSYENVSCKIKAERAAREEEESRPPPSSPAPALRRAALPSFPGW